MEGRWQWDGSPGKDIRPASVMGTNPDRPVHTTVTGGQPDGQEDGEETAPERHSGKDKNAQDTHSDPRTPASSEKSSSTSARCSGKPCPAPDCLQPAAEGREPQQASLSLPPCRQPQQGWQSWQFPASCLLVLRPRATQTAPPCLSFFIVHGVLEMTL